MAARKRRTRLNDAWRERIQTSMLINRLQDYVLADLSGLNGDDEEAKKARRRAMMTAGQVKAAFGLLKKTLPNLSHVEVETTTRRTLDQMIIDSYQYDAEFSDSSEDLSDEMHH